MENFGIHLEYIWNFLDSKKYPRREEKKIEEKKIEEKKIE